MSTLAIDSFKSRSACDARSATALFIAVPRFDASAATAEFICAGNVPAAGAPLTSVASIRSIRLLRVFASSVDVTAPASTFKTKFVFVTVVAAVPL